MTQNNANVAPSAEVLTLKELYFNGGDEVEDLIEYSYKLVTIRRAHAKYDFKDGEEVLGKISESGEEIPLIVVTNTKKPLKELTQQELLLDGYANHQEALADLQKFYPELTMDDEVNCIFFVTKEQYESLVDITEDCEKMVGMRVTEILEAQTDYRNRWADWVVRVLTNSARFWREGIESRYSET